MVTIHFLESTGRVFLEGFMISLCLHSLLCASLVGEVVVAEVKVFANTGEPVGIMLFDSLLTFRRTANISILKDKRKLHELLH